MNPWVEYENGNYRVRLNLVDGTKIRFTDDDEFRAAFPESMDIKITNRCDIGCPWCHEDSQADGEHAIINQAFLDTLHPYEEIAVGGGNVLSHPQLVDFLEILQSKQCVPSITLNQKHFLENLDFIEDLKKRKLIFGIGVSLVEPTDELITALKRFPTAVIHTIAGILSPDDVIKLSGHRLKILILGYKSIRRGAIYRFLGSNDETIEKNMQWLGDNLMAMFGSFKVVSFDNLALEQLPVRKTIGEEQWKAFYMGDDGQHTFYIDMVSQEYAVSSTSTKRNQIGSKSIDEMFADVMSASQNKQ